MEKEQNKNEFIQWTKALIFAFTFAFFIRFFLFVPIIVDGESMELTLHNEERMIVNKLDYKFNEPQRYDIIVFHANEDDDYIKRVIGLPGEHISYKDDQLYVNGEPQAEPYLDPLKKELKKTNFTLNLTEDFTLEQYTGETKIPEGFVFVIGDNRQKSKDSRTIGLIPISEIVGKTNTVFWPLNDIRIVK